VICFIDREDLAERHLNVGLVDKQYQPLPQLLTEHLSQGVWRHCFFPRWKDERVWGTLNPPAIEEISPEDDELEDHDPSVQIEQFSMKEREYGEGKFAFESYLATSLSRNHIVPTLWRYAEDD
jgi:hypothetical protein